ncbi:MAG: Ig-like domain-containing protein, partial [Syntrophomonadaceae bacterium]|nr:Ig-like domain-containing protein [Syntrophomonadaceae bacterium]
RVVASGNTSVGTVQLGSGAALIESNSSGPGFEKVSLADTIPAGSKVSLSGSFSEVNVDAAKVNLAVVAGSIARMEVAAKASRASINVAGDARISTLTLNAAVSVTGRGTIDTAKVSVAGTTFEQKPAAIENPNNVSINTGVSTSGGGGGGSGTGSGNNPLSFLSSDPADGSTGISSTAIIRLTFDRGVVRNYWDNNQSCISMQDSSGQAVAIMVYRATNYLDDSEKENIYVAPNSSLTAGSSYTLTISAGLKANNGNTLGTARSITFTVAASSGGGGGGSGTGGGSGNNPLGFVSADPADGSTGLSATPTIKLTFDRGVAGDYWDNNQTCVSMNDSSGQSIAIMVTRATNYEEDSEKCNIYVTPASSLTAGSSYTLTVAAGLKANNGNALGTAKTITYTVAGSSTPGTLGISDGDGRSGLNAKAANGPADGAQTGCNVMAFKLMADAVEDIIISTGNNISIAMSNIGGLAQDDLTNIELFTDPNGDGSTDDGALVAVGVLGSITEGNGLITFNLSSQQTIAASGYINYILQFDTTANWGDNDTFTLASDSISINASGGTSQQAANVTGSITQRNFVNPVDSAGVPVYQNSEITNQGDVSIYFSQNMESTLALAGKEGQFTVMVNEVPVSVTALQLTSTTTKIKLVLASKVSNGQSVTVAYTKDADANKQVKSSGGGVLESFSAKPVTNN